jgi:hypothetical protein
MASAPASASVPTTTLWWNVPGVSTIMRESSGCPVLANSIRRMSLV